MEVECGRAKELLRRRNRPLGELFSLGIFSERGLCL